MQAPSLDLSSGLGDKPQPQNNLPLLSESEAGKNAGTSTTGKSLFCQSCWKKDSCLHSSSNFATCRHLFA